MSSSTKRTSYNDIYSSPEKEYKTPRNINKLTKSNSNYYNGKIKYKYPSLKQLDPYFPKDSAANSEDHWKIIQYNKNHGCRYIRKLPLFHLLPEDSSIYFNQIIPAAYEDNTQRILIKRPIVINHIQERLTKSINILNKKSNMKNVSVSSSPDTFWITKQLIEHRNQGVQTHSKLPMLSSILYQSNKKMINTSSLCPCLSLKKSTSVDELMKSNNFYQSRRKKNHKAILFQRNAINRSNNI